ncbi:ATP-binding protein [Piscinibacter sp.]|uniref:ATP-binding protein n=1 Tax=Piscinibacter sp. TaxID=1903157 RepID=UPI00355A8480
MQSAPHPPNEARRLAVLRELGVLDSEGEASFDALVDAAARLTGCPIALISLVDAQRQWFKAARGWAMRETPRDISFCAHAILGDALFEVEDTRRDVRFTDNPLVRGEPHIRFYAGEPLQFRGATLGTLCVMDTQPRTLGADERAALHGLSRVATELLHSRQRLRALNDEQRRLLDFGRASGDWMWEIDEQLVYRWVSGTVEPVTGIVAETLIGHPINDDLPLLDAHGMPESHGLRFGELLRRREPISRALTEKHTPRGLLYVSRSAVPVFDSAGQFKGFRGTARDVSAQVEAARRSRAQDVLLRQLSSQLPGVIFQLQMDADGVLRYPYASDGMRELFGVEPPQGAAGDRSAALRMLHPDDRAAYLDSILASARLLRPWHHEYRIVRKDGSVRWLETRATPERLRDGGTLWHGFTADVSDRKETELLRRDKEAAERANREKNEFLSRVSHELRTPLNSILGFAQLMSLDRVNPLAPDQQRRVDSVLRAGRHLLELINDVLDVTRIESEDFSLQPGMFDAWAAINECLSLIQPLADRAEVHLPVSEQPSPCWVRADPRAFEQVLMNLLSNAIKYNRPGGDVELSVAEHAARVHIAVRDTGRGMSAEQQAALFQPFNRLGAEQSRTEGSGLGLVISRRLVEAMGGALSVHSELDVGSTFSIELPAGEGSAGVAAQVPFARTAPAGLPDVPRDVLYIEDEPLNAVLMKEVFRSRPNWTLRVAEDGANGARIARDVHPDLVLIDMNLPDMTGLTLIRRLRGDPATRRLHCIALSADAMREQIEAALAAGFDDYWTKPIDVKRMLSDLTRLLAEPADHEQ